MSKKKLATKDLNKNKQTVVLKNPGDTIWGKVILGLIILGTVGTILVPAIILLINYFK